MRHPRRVMKLHPFNACEAADEIERLATEKERHGSKKQRSVLLARMTKQMKTRRTQRRR